MTLTIDQIATLRAHADTVPAMQTAIANSDDAAIRDYFNGLSTEYGWRTNVQPNEYLLALDWTEVDSLTAGPARIWEWMTSLQSRPLNFSKSNVRAGLANAFSVAQAPDSRAGLLSIASRLMTIAEKVLSSGGSGTASDARIMTFEGSITIQDASNIRAYGD